MKGKLFVRQAVRARGSLHSLPDLDLSPLVSLALNPFLSLSLQVKPRRRLEKDIRRIREKRKGSQATALGDRKFQHCNIPFLTKEEAKRLLY